MESQKMMQDMMSKYDQMKSKLENTKEKQFMNLQFTYSQERYKNIEY